MILSLVCVLSTKADAKFTGNDSSQPLLPDSTISPLSTGNIKNGKVDSKRNVDISNLSSGFYILTVEKNGKIIGSTKFVR